MSKTIMKPKNCQKMNFPAFIIFILFRFRQLSFRCKENIFALKSRYYLGISLCKILAHAKLHCQYIVSILRTEDTLEFLFCLKKFE